MFLRGDDDRQFLVIDTEPGDTATTGTAIILHGRGLHPDWVNVVQPLRVGLPQHGWRTLSIQLPVLDTAASYYDYVEIFDAAFPRIEAAVAHARAQGDGPVVLIAHSCGAHMAQHWVLARGQAAVQQIDGYVGIGMGATDYGQPMREPFALEHMPIPVLDVFAANDYPAVRRSALTRLSALLRAGNPHSKQRVVADAEHYFVDRGDVLLEVLTEWLRETWPVEPEISSAGSTPDRPRP
jgi:hypothetical protein